MKPILLIFTTLLLACACRHAPLEGRQRQFGFQHITSLEHNTMKMEIAMRLPWAALDSRSPWEVGTPQIATMGYPARTENDVMRAEVSLKVTPSGKFAVLMPGAIVQLWGAQSSKALTYDIGHHIAGIDSMEVVDFVVDAADNLYALLHSEDAQERGKGINTLLKIDQFGKLLWKQSQQIDLRATRFKPLLRQVLLSGEKVLLVEVGKTTSVHEVAPEAGNWMPLLQLDQDYEDLRVDGAGRLYFVSWDQGTGLRYWNQYDIATQQVIAKQGNAEIYPYLPFPLGANAEGDAYCYFGNTLAKLDSKSQSVQTFAPSNILLDETQSHVVIFRYEDDQMCVERLQGHAPQIVKIDGAKAHATQHGVGAWILVLMEPHRWVFRGFSATENRFLFLDYDPQAGKFADATYHLEKQLDLYRAQAPRTWGFATGGTLYIPVAGPDALTIVKMSGW